MSVVAGKDSTAPAEPRTGARRRKKPRLRAPSPVRDRIEYLVLRAIVGCFAALPLALAVRVAAAVAWVAWLVAFPLASNARWDLPFR